MNDALRSRVDRFYPEPNRYQAQDSTEARIEEERRKATQAKALEQHEQKENERQIAKLKKQALAEARMKKAMGQDTKKAEERIQTLEAIEMQAAKEEAPQRAIIDSIQRAPGIPMASAKELIASQGTTRADVQKLLTNLNINLDLRLTKTDTANLLACLLTCNESQLAVLEKNNKVPLAIKIVIKRLRDDVKVGNMAALERIWDRVFGKAAMTVEVPEQSTMAGIIPNTPISREAYVVIRETLLK